MVSLNTVVRLTQKRQDAPFASATLFQCCICRFSQSKYGKPDQIDNTALDCHSYISKETS